MKEKTGANQESPNTPLSFQLSSPASSIPPELQCTKPQVKSEQELGDVLHVADHAQRMFLVQSVGQSEAFNSLHHLFLPFLLPHFPTPVTRINSDYLSSLSSLVRNSEPSSPDLMKGSSF